MKNYQMYIDGKFCDAKAGATLESVNPANEEKIAVFPKASSEDLERAIQAARRAYDEGEWPRMSLPERASFLVKIAHIIRESAYEIARL